ncbi:MAG: hypothetical protein M1817_002122 [Caeruleum heppii]|nr:MAG: hypothetical protein M1817_002122 [Caeruleum heppii]
MPLRKGILPREGLTADPIGRLIKKTVLNPALTLPLLLLARYTQQGQVFALDHETALKRLRLLFYFGVARWINGFLSRGALNNWKTDTYDWNKEIIIVTGGSDGIGKAVVTLLAERGTRVIVLDVQPLTFEAPPNVSYFKCDISSPENIASVASEIRQAHGHPTVLVNNAGVARGKTILDATEADVRLTFDVNTLSHYWLAKEFLPYMIEKNHGMIVTVASMAGYVTAPIMTDYASSKAAAISFHDGLAVELKTQYNALKVRTVLVTQSYTKTPLFTGYDNKSSFLAPTLEPETVADEIAKKVWGGNSDHVVLPGFLNWFCGFRGFPHWLQLHFRNDNRGNMTNWNGRQVMDAEVKYAKKAE